jgi:hypothetical protein
MRNRVMSILSAAVLAAATPVLAAASEPQAPPMLTPAVARDASDACPGTGKYAAALVRGITLVDAGAAERAFAACAQIDRLPGFRWKTTAATVALAAVDLSRGLLDRDATLISRAADATAELRHQSAATDEQVRAWTVIPDEFDMARGGPIALAYLPLIANNASTPRSSYLFGPWIEDAAYINVAARTGSAWIATPRTFTSSSYDVAPAIPTASPVRRSIRPNPAMEPAVGEPH